eukprot:768213-Hanusia_phi.AAC.3
MWNRTLSSEEVRASAKCVDLDKAKTCDNTISFSVSAPRTAYSSVLGGDQPGEGNARGRLNSKAAWCAASNKVGNYMQMDTGSAQTVLGVVIQGKKDANFWVTGFKVQISNDGQSFVDAFCGQYFTANDDRETKVKKFFPYPIDARYVRIVPWSWHGAMCMRAGLIICEKPCINGELDFHFRQDFLSTTYGPPLDPSWGEGNFVGPHGPYEFPAGKGLQLDRKRCISGNAWTILIHASLADTDGWRRIVNSKGWGDTGVFVNKVYRMYPTSTEIACQEQIDPNKMYIFGVSRSAAGEVKLYLNGEVCSKGSPDISNKFSLDLDDMQFFHDDGGQESAGQVSRIRMWNHQLDDQQVAVLCDCKLPQVGTECEHRINFVPANQMITYSSVLGNDASGEGNGRGRLNSKQGWSSLKNEVGQFMVLDTGMVQSIVGVVTQGRHDANQWVTSYSVQVSEDGLSWKDVHCGRVFPANGDRDSKVKTVFGYPVRARYVMIEPQSWFGHMSMRAGVLLCERPCENDQLDYRFQMSFLSSTHGPPLLPYWGEGSFDTPDGPYTFSAGKGFRLEQIRCLTGSAYSVIMDLALDDTTGWRRLLSSDGWDDNGLYVNENLQIFPKSANVRCPETIRPKQMYKIGMVRSTSGTVSLYLHGAKCASGDPLFSNKFELSNKWMDFFHDDGSENSAGSIKRIRLFGKALSDVEVATYCGCTLAKFGNPCTKYIIFSPPDYNFAYSSVWDNNPVGVSHGRGRLRSAQAWSAKQSKVGEWMQIDGGEIQSIAGVVVQGRRDNDQWVTTFKVEVSDDGSKWVQVECGRIFDGNSDRNTKVFVPFPTPVVGRYVRIYPQTWVNFLSMRAAILLCERPCVGGELEYRFRDSFISSTKGPSLEALWGEGTFDVMKGYQFADGQGLSVLQASCLKSKSYSIYVQAQLDTVTGWHKIIGSDGWGDSGFYVNSVFQSFPTASGVKCDEKIRPGQVYQFVITRSSDGEVKLYLNGWLCESGTPPYDNGYQLEESGVWFFHDAGGKDASGYVRNLKMWDRTLSDAEVLTQCACTLPKTATACDNHVVINPPDMQFSYSTVSSGSQLGTGNAQGRLNSPFAWIPASATSGTEFMTIDIGEVLSVSGVVTQGRRSGNQWVTALQVEVSEDGRSFLPVECGRTWDANQDSNTKVRILFSSPLRARYVRILPKAFSGNIAMRAAVLVCERPCKDGQLDYNFRGSLTSSTKGPGLVAEWGDGNFDPDEGYEFAKGTGLSLPVGRCIKGDAYTIYILAKLKETTGYRRMIGSDGWVDNGLYVNSYFMTYPPVAGLRCKEIIRPDRWYQFVISRTEDGTVTLYLNGFLCQSGKPPYAENYKLNPEEIDFFHDDGQENTAGFIQKIKIWDSALDSKKVLEECNCYLPLPGKPCDAYIVLNAMYPQIKYSSVRGASAVGSGYGQGRLNSPGSFSPGTTRDTEWMQIDTGDVQSIPGVVIQGSVQNQWVTSFKIEVSDDEEIWTKVECGRVFDGNDDATTKVKVMFSTPVKARYVRLFPVTFQGWPAFRFGILLCERPCENAELDFRFLDNFRSSTKGPSLDTPWGSGSFDSAKGYRFSKGQGLQLDEYNCINKTAYTIYMDVSLDSVDGYRRLIGSDGWDQNGLFVDKKVTTFPAGGSLSCEQLIKPGVFYQYVLSRGSDANVKLYLNGYLCSSGKIPYSEGYKLSPHEITFFKDDSARESAGYVKEIKIWDRQLTDVEAATECGCTLTTAGESCDDDSVVIYNAKDQNYKFSSIYQNNRVGEGFGAGRLNSEQGWTPQLQEVGQYMQIDLGSLRSIKGVITQGRRNVGWWVTTLTVAVSDNGASWKQVECGRIFNANSDWGTAMAIMFSASVQGRYVRIFPQTWVGSISLRASALICEEKCEGGELDYRFQGTFASNTLGPMLQSNGKIGDFELDGSIWQYKFDAGEGFTLDEGKCISPSEYTVMMYLQIKSTDGKKLIMGSSTWGNNGLFVDTILKMYPVSSELACDEHIWTDRWYSVGLTRSGEGLVSLYLNGFLCASNAAKNFDGYKFAAHDINFFDSKAGYSSNGYIRSLQLWKTKKTEDEMATLAGCSLPETSDKQCKNTILLNVPYSRHTYSDASWQPGAAAWSQGQINAQYCWRPNRVVMGGKYPPYEGGIWMQLDSGREQTIAGVATQGYSGSNNYVSYLSVKVSKDGSSWTDVACGRIFEASSDASSVKKILFPEPVVARYVKIFPQKYVNYPDIRAAILLCEKKCQSGQLDYQLDSAFTSSTDGPMIDTPWGVGTFDTTNRWYRFSASQGLALDASECLDAKTWTVLIHAKLDIINSWRQLFGTGSWKNDGLYVNNKYQFFPQSSNLFCDEVLRPDRFYEFGLSRASDGTVSIFLKGFLCTSAKVEMHDDLKLDTKDISFFHSEENSKNTAGYLKRIRMWSKALTAQEMASACQCSLIDPVDTDCKGTVITNLPYDKHTYSSTWANYEAGRGYATGMLDSSEGWLCSNANVGFENGCWFQLDSGKVQSIAGVVSQGRAYGNWWVTAYAVKVSEDGERWTEVACGKIFEGNTDSNTKVQNLFPFPVKARYVRIYPMYYYSHPAMRAGLLICERKCEDGKLDYGFQQSLTSSTGGTMLKTPWGSGPFADVSGKLAYRMSDGKGLQLNPYECIKGDTYTILIDALLSSVSGSLRIFGVDSWENDGLYVNKVFSMQPDDLKLVCNEEIKRDLWYKYGITRNSKGEISVYLNGFLCGTATSKFHDGYALKDELIFFRSPSGQQPNGYMNRLRLWNKALKPDEVAKECGCVLPTDGSDCSNAVTTNPGYKGHRYSSIYQNREIGTTYGEGMLNSITAWLPNSAKTGFENGEWMQMDAGESTTILGVVTQGRGDGGWWTTEYQVKVSSDGKSWADIACGRIFKGNSDMNTKVYNLFPSNVKARYVRIYPYSYVGYPSMRAGLLTCETKCKDKMLDYTFDMSLASVTGGPMLVADKAEGTFDRNQHAYRFSAGQGLLLDESRCVKPETWSTVIEARLDTISNWRQIFGADSWSTDGAYVNNNYQWNPAISGLSCDEVIKANEYYQFGITEKEGVVSLYLNGYLCGSAKTTNKKGYELDPNNLRFLEGTSASVSSAGYAKRIRLWSKALDDKEMAEACNCKLAEPSDTKCPGSIIMNVNYDRHKFSASWGNYKAGEVYARGMLDSPDAFIPPQAYTGTVNGHWLQLDTGAVQGISGVVIQGRSCCGQFLRSFFVKISSDGSTWQDVECGRSFNGNTDTTTKVNVFFRVPLKGRYIRIYPDVYNSWPSWRAGVLVRFVSFDLVRVDVVAGL